MGNTLRTSDSEGEATKGATRHLERGREAGYLLKRKAFSNDIKMSTAQKRAPARVALSTPV